MTSRSGCIGRPSAVELARYAHGTNKCVERTAREISDAEDVSPNL